MTPDMGWNARISVLWSCALLLASGLALSGCFDPQFAQCAVECGIGGLCPPGTTCSSDGTCHGSGIDTPMVCPPKMPDAALTPDASNPDAPIVVPDANVLDAGDDCGNNVVQSGLGETCDDGNQLDTDGCNSICRTEPGFFCLGSPSECAAAPIAGQLIITEIQKNPCADQGGCQLNDVDAEWFEVQNVSMVDLQLLNMIIKDADLEEVRVVTPLTIGPGQILLFGNNSDMEVNGRVSLDYQYPTTFVLANGNDEIILRNPLTQEEIDRVVYNEVNFPSFAGSSLSLDPDFYDGISNDTGANWCDGDDVYGPGDFGTPGLVNPQCP